MIGRQLINQNAKKKYMLHYSSCEAIDVIITISLQNKLAAIFTTELL